MGGEAPIARPGQTEAMDDDAAPAEGGPPAVHTGRALTNVAALETMYQFVLWLVPVLDGLPRSQKFQLGDRLQTTALDVLDTLVEAAYTRDRAALLRQANLGLEKLRYWVRLAKDLKLMDFKRFEHAARLIDDIGRQVGGWQRAERRGRPGAAMKPGAGDHATPA